MELTIVILLALSTPSETETATTATSTGTNTSELAPMLAPAVGALPDDEIPPDPMGDDVPPDDGSYDDVVLEVGPHTRTATAVGAQKTGTKVNDPMLDEVVVTGSRGERRLADSAVATEVITRKEILASGSENAAEALDKAPGIQVTQSFRGAGSGIQLQGLDAQHVLILVDGQRVIGRKDGVVDLTRFTAERIERIEVVKGAASALYGADAVGGVVNIITRRPEDEFEGSIHSVYGSYNRLDLSGDVGGAHDSLRGQITGGYHRGDAYRLDESSPAISGSEFSEGNVEGRVDYDVTDNVRLIARADYLRRASDGIDTNPQGGVLDRRNRTQTLSGSLATDIRSEGNRVQGTVYFSMFDDDFLLDQRDSDEFTQSQTKERLGQLTFQYDRVLFDEHLVSVGVEGLYEALEAPGRLDDDKGDRGRFSVFAQDEWTLNETPWLALVPGVRVDVDTQFGSYGTPRVAARVDLAEEVIVRLSVASAFRAPSFRELLLVFDNFSAGYVINGNPDLDPENSRNINFGVELRPTTWLWATANFYRNDIDNLIQLESVGEVGAITQFSYVNIARAVTQGLESMVRIVPIDLIQLEFGYTFLDSEDLATGRTLEGRAEHRFTYKLLFTEKSWGTTAWLRGTWVGERPFYDEALEDFTITDVVAEPYTTFDVRAQQNIGKHIQVFIGVDNVLDAGDVRFNPILPRSFYGGINGRL